jgi:hypothetical protein
VFYNKPTIGNSQEKKPGTAGNPGFLGKHKREFHPPSLYPDN